jgi:hypothetical protein
MFGIIRHVERRESNEQLTASDGIIGTKTKTLYQISVARVIAFWLVIWVSETDY